MNTTSIQFSQLLVNALSEPGMISRAYSMFHRYSLGNVLAASYQCAIRGVPISPIASYKTWQAKGRQVKKGEKAIALCMPITHKGEKEKPNGEKEAFAYSRFIWKANWFLLSQTDGIAVAEEALVEEPDVLTHIPHWDKQQAFDTLGISFAPFEHYDGNCQGYARGRAVAVNPLAVYPHKACFRAVAHVLLGHTQQGQTIHNNTGHASSADDMEAEAVAFLLCSLYDLPGTLEARAIIQSWAMHSGINEKSAQKVFRIADKILKAGTQTNLNQPEPTQTN